MSKSKLEDKHKFSWCGFEKRCEKCYLRSFAGQFPKDMPSCIPDDFPKPQENKKLLDIPHSGETLKFGFSRC